MTTDVKPELRKTGIGVVGDVPWGTHLCHFYETENDLLDILIPYFKAGLEEHEFCLWVVFYPLGNAEAKAALRSGIPHFDRRLAAGDIEIVPHTEVYLQDGKLDMRKTEATMKEKHSQALAKGYAGMRISTNKAWLTANELKYFLDSEKRLKGIIALKGVIILCTYPLAICRADELFDLARSHDFAVLRRNGNWEVLETPELNQARAALGKLNEELERRIEERTRELAAANQDLKREIAERKEAESALRGSHRRLRALTARLESLREEERIRVAREIHDELGQTLTGLKLNMHWMERKLGEMAASEAANALLDRVVGSTELVDSVTTAVQRIAADLRPGALDNLGLGPALQFEARRFEERTGIHCEVRLPEAEPALTTPQATALFRMFQESLTNVARHAEARTVGVELRVEDGAFILTIQDDGRGITEADIARPESLGLLGMKERAELLGGEIVFQRNAGRQGTVVTARIPQAGALHPNGKLNHARVNC